MFSPVKLSFTRRLSFNIKKAQQNYFLTLLHPKPKQGIFRCSPPRFLNANHPLYQPTNQTIHLKPLIMLIEKHWLKAENSSEKIVKSETLNVRDVIDPDYLILHYTACDTAKEAVNWFMNQG